MPENIDLNNIKPRKSGKYNKLVPVLAATLMLNLSSCDFSKKESINKKETDSTIVLEPESYDQDKVTFGDQVESARINGVNLPKILPNGNIGYYYKYGTADITFIFKKKNNGLYLINITDNNLEKSGKNQIKRINEILEQNGDEKVKDLKNLIDNVLNILVYGTVKEPNPAAMKILEELQTGNYETVEEAIKKLEEKDNIHFNQAYSKYLDTVIKDDANKRNDKENKATRIIILDTGTFNGRNISVNSKLDNDIIYIDVKAYNTIAPADYKDIIEIDISNIDKNELYKYIDKITQEITSEIKKHFDAYNDQERKIITDEIRSVVTLLIYKSN